jgi:tetratricopeptide (TPR) repeat protein
MKNLARFERSVLLFMGACLVLLLASCDSFLYQEPTTEISKNEALSDIESVESSLFGAYNLMMDNPDAYRSFLTYYADLTGGNVTINPGLTSQAKTELRRIEEFNSLSDLTVSSYTALYEILNAVNNVANAIPTVPDGTQEQKDRILGQALGLRALVHFDLVRLYAQPYTYTEDASHIGIVVLTESPQPNEELPRSTVRDAYEQIIEDLERAIELLDGEPFNPRFINAINAKALLAKVHLYQQEWAKVVTLCNEVIDSGATQLAPTDDLLAMWQNGYTRNEFLLRLDGSAYSTYTLSSDWGNRSANTSPVLSATSDVISLYAPADVRGLGPGKLIQTTVDDGDTLYSSLKYPEPPNQAPNNIGVMRLAEVYLNRAEAYANLSRPEPARDDLNTIRRRANPGAELVTASGPALLDRILEERRKELAFEGHLLYDRTRYEKDVTREYCSGKPSCDESYPSPKFVLPVPIEALSANSELIQNEGY